MLLNLHSVTQICIFEYNLKHKAMDTRKYKKQLGLKHEPARFINRESAMRWSNNTVKMSMVMLGCDGKFWVVCPADATRLYKMGYEYAA